VPVAFLLHAILEDHGDTKHKDHVDTDDTEGGSEHSIQICIGERGEFTNASSLLSSDQGVLACAILHERRRG
jgi:hypothetical protein